MSCLKKALLLGAMVLVGMFGAGTTVAWVPMNYRDFEGVRNINLFVEGGSLTFQLEQHGSRQFNDGSDLAALRASLARINAIPTSSAAAVDGGTFDFGDSVDADSPPGIYLFDWVNRIYFFNEDTDNSFQGIASAVVFFDAFSGPVLGCDIAFDGFRVKWSTATPAKPNQRLGPNTYDIGEVASREIQHCYGIDYSPIAGRFDQSTGLQVSGFFSGDFSLQSTIFPYATGTIEGRNLKPDDIAGFSTLYPNDQGTGSLGRISGRILRADGSAVKGVHVVAVPANDPTRPLVGALSGVDAEADPGGYRLTGLPPGNYFVRIEPLVGTTNPFTELNTPFFGFDTSFPPEFYSGASESAVDAAIGSDDAAEIEVTAGGEVLGIDVIVNTPGVGPAMSCLPSRLVFVGSENGPNPPAQRLFLKNIGGGTDDWGIGQKPSWLVVNPLSGALTAQGDSISVSADLSKLSAGTYRAKLMFYAREALNNAQVVSVLLVVTPQSGHILPACPGGCKFSSIQAAINASASGDTVWVGPGHYAENVVMKDGVKVVGAGSERSIIDAGGNGIVVMCASNTLLDGFTITGGNNTSVQEQGFFYTGAGIKCKDALDVEISHNLIANNQIPEDDAQGAGLYIRQSNVLVLDNVFRGNTTGFYRVYHGGVSGGDGGAISLENDAFDGSRRVTIARNRIVDNLSGGGGGIWARVSWNQLDITDNVIARNDVTYFGTLTGGGVFLDKPSNTPVVITNDTIVDNFNGLMPGNISGIEGNGFPPVTITNTIVRGNVYDSDGEIVGAELAVDDPTFFDFDVSYSMIGGGYEGTRNSAADPLFRDRPERDYRLRPNSPAIDAGNNTAPGSGAYDLAGVPRISNGNRHGGAVADIGAFELAPRPTGPKLVFSPPLIVFPPQALFTTSKPIKATLLSVGDLSARITGLVTTGDFGQTNNCGSAVVVGTTCAALVTFKPTMIGPRKGKLGVLTDAALQREVQLQGFGASNLPPKH